MEAITFFENSQRKFDPEYMRPHADQFDTKIFAQLYQEFLCKSQKKQSAQG